jgi:hypothetical protein
LKKEPALTIAVVMRAIPIFTLGGIQPFSPEVLDFEPLTFELLGFGSSGIELMSFD